ncbi:MAG: SGNH/GDSL hydrolase family protein [Muribaculaceae bacterium]|nr:SGNH/GDSL hydrolase family protein [Muribaculaceae bacterium]
MRRTYFGLFALLVVAFSIFAGMSFFSEDFEEECGLKTSSFASDLFSHSFADLTSSDTIPGLLRSKSTSGVTEAAPLDTTKKNILFIGDSMLERLSPRFAAYAEENGHQMNTVIWYGSTTEVWANSKRAAEKIKTYHPDFIIISLGGNELFIKDIITRRSKFVKEILSEFGKIPYVWIGPPNWKEDTGINKMLQSIIPEGNFYLSYTPDQHYDRASDGAHPTAASAAKWADRICRWIMNQSNHPIVLNVPNKEKSRCHTECFGMSDDGDKPAPKAAKAPAAPAQKKAAAPAAAPQPAAPAAQPEVAPTNTEN